MGIIVDTGTRIPGDALAAAGVSFVIRYLSSIPGPKIITFDELVDLRTHGISILLVYEDTINDMGGGFDAGIKHGQVAVYEAAVVGYPAGCGIYFASDNTQLLPETRDTFGAANFVAHHYGYRSGWYGNGDWGRLFLDGFGNRYDQCDLVWAVSTWGTRQFGGLHLVQDANHPQVVIAGVAADWDYSLAADFGQWAA